MRPSYECASGVFSRKYRSTSGLRLTPVEQRRRASHNLADAPWEYMGNSVADSESPDDGRRPKPALLMDQPGGARAPMLASHLIRRLGL